MSRKSTLKTLTCRKEVRSIMKRAIYLSSCHAVSFLRPSDAEQGFICFEPRPKKNCITLFTIGNINHHPHKFTMGTSLFFSNVRIYFCPPSERSTSSSSAHLKPSRWNGIYRLEAPNAPIYLDSRHFFTRSSAVWPQQQNQPTDRQLGPVDMYV